MWTTQRRVYFREADPAGLLFFGNVYALVHDAYEEFLMSLGIDWKSWFEGREYIVPIRHSEADYQKPLFPGQPAHIGLEVLEVGKTSWKLGFQIWQEQPSQPNVKGHLVLVFVDPKTMQSRPVPETFSRAVASRK